jgi:benzoyl-CoA 2,3-dioxygenase component B
VEQQRVLGASAPSLYDLRNLFQVNVEEGRHLWAMAYLLHAHFGRDGREEAEALLERRSGDADKPRILGAFNASIDDWLDFMMFAMFTDRDGKFQLRALAESGFDPLSRTCRFMLIEEAHHLFVGQTGIERIVRRTAELMRQDPNEDARARGGIDLPTIQRYLNQWYALSLDLFGGEISSNAALYFATGLKGLAAEDGYEDHVALGRRYEMQVLREGRLRREEVPLRNALNEVMRDEYSRECERCVARWNALLERSAIAQRLRLPARQFFRHVGQYANQRFDVDGRPITLEEWQRRRNDWLPTGRDRAYVASLQKAVREPGKIANWIAPPSRGIKGKAFEFEYVRFD